MIRYGYFDYARLQDDNGPSPHCSGPFEIEYLDPADDPRNDD
ncbi:hypothetical protein SAHL_00840 [Salinisphaera orenii YIM 95161]|uniref:Uncharacterized protein n=1 Tax=Salinisphaera orenii YIM 95161 TaxID=1051139 RepID=A0A423QBF9_9GAMM|nr:hypothetical protein SAHL_00840 [Salinisphaera halophila YIM 95161]